LKIALLTDSIEAGSPGFASYAMGLADALAELPAGDACTLVHRGAHPFYEERRHEMPRAAGGLPLMRQLRLPPYLEAGGYDVVHDTYHFGPFVRPSRFARVLTIGDLTPLVTPTHRPKQKWAHRLLAPLVAHRAHHIVTFSDCSKRDIVRLFRIAPEKISVTYLAAHPRFRPAPPADVEDGRRRLRLPERYFLHVGTLEPRKNIERLVRAYARALPAIGDEVALLLAGRRGWRMEGLPLLLRTAGVADRVIMRDDITDDDLPLVYGGALALTYPSLYEGFGLPPLEAMQCGVPVLTSHRSSLPEVVGEDALLVDAASVDAIAAGLKRLASDEALRADLARRGRRRAATFSWRVCAEQTFSAYERALAAARMATTVAPARVRT